MSYLPARQQAKRMLTKKTEMSVSLQVCPLTAVMTKQACPNGGYCMYLSLPVGSASVTISWGQ